MSGSNQTWKTRNQCSFCLLHRLQQPLQSPLLLQTMNWCPSMSLSSLGGTIRILWAIILLSANPATWKLTRLRLRLLGSATRRESRFPLSVSWLQRLDSPAFPIVLPHQHVLHLQFLLLLLLQWNLQRFLRACFFLYQKRSPSFLLHLLVRLASMMTSSFLLSPQLLLLLTALVPILMAWCHHSALSHQHHSLEHNQQSFSVQSLSRNPQSPPMVGGCESSQHLILPTRCLCLSPLWCARTSTLRDSLSSHSLTTCPLSRACALTSRFNTALTVFFF